MSSRRKQKDQAKALRNKKAAKKNFATSPKVIATMLVVVVAVILGSLFLMSRTSSSTTSNKTLPSSSASTSNLALNSIDGQHLGDTVDGISCDATEKVLFHIHAHLAVYAGGLQLTIPEGIGIPPPQQIQGTGSAAFVASGKCFYWLHSHTPDGIVHIESPIQRDFTLGNYFDIWNRTLNTTTVGTATGNETIYVDGTKYTGNPRDIVLKSHTNIQINLGQDVPYQNFTYPNGL